MIFKFTSNRCVTPATHSVCQTPSDEHVRHMRIRVKNSISHCLKFQKNLSKFGISDYQDAMYCFAENRVKFKKDCLRIFFYKVCNCNRDGGSPNVSGTTIGIYRLLLFLLFFLYWQNRWATCPKISSALHKYPTYFISF